MTSNIPPLSKDSIVEKYPVYVTEGDLEAAYSEIGPISVVIRKPSLFHAAPTQKHARSGLMQKAREIGADAVIRVVYTEGFDAVTWGHIEASGIAVKTNAPD